MADIDANARSALIDHIVAHHPGADRAALEALAPDALINWEVPPVVNEAEETQAATAKQVNYLSLLSKQPLAIGGDAQAVAEAQAAAAQPNLTKYTAHDLIEILQRNVQPTARQRHAILAHRILRFPKTPFAAGWANFTCADASLALAAREL